MLRLRPYKKCDAKHIASWIKDERAFRLWSADRYEKYPVTSDDINEHYAAMDDSDAFFGMTAYDEESVVGHLIMRFTDENKSVVRFGFIIVDTDKRGKGYGKEMLLLAVKYAFNILKADKITLGVFENNESARMCYKGVGFKESMSEEPSVFRIMGEEWNCIELEMKKE